MQQLINVIAYITAKPGSEAVVESALKTAEKAVQSEAGCHSYVLTKDIQQENRYVMLERWENQEALDVHMQQAPFKQLVAEIEGLATLEVVLTKKVGDL
ncbi:antibiotic biosynthesis monooxygenase [Rosenbergiella australiborealis]|uniref:Antibiotic biosynthesis monooxygenase n=1 Tax=Rosenbergiella australiborealis TaxID=1544696 RepID=A0ABS5T4S2_9GAMM|nr:putative quinol monooxygenase [Rosenbergiella australiborealis]MBT0727336.1 antibiotic biosynthesis monooxygenase [Rosenbergiella australiborealis]